MNVRAIAMIAVVALTCWLSINLSEHHEGDNSKAFEFLYGHVAISKAGYADIVSACGDPAKGPNAWGGSPDPPDGTAAYRSEECEAARQKANGNVGSFEVRARARILWRSGRILS